MLHPIEVDLARISNHEVGTVDPQLVLVVLAGDPQHQAEAVPVRIDPELRAAIETRAEQGHTTVSEIIREAIRRDGRTLYRLALDSGVNSAVLGRFMRGERDLNLRTAERVCDAIGLEVRPKRQPKGKGR